MSSEQSEPNHEPGSQERFGNGMIPAALRQVWRAVVLVVGFTVVAVGVAMIVLPGPAVVVIPAGLAILATEFVWARRLLDRVKAEIALRAFKDRVKR
jgi:tellurite resistance protein TerC